jgi:hypothetical protein
MLVVEVKPPRHNKKVRKCSVMCHFLDEPNFTKKYPLFANVHNKLVFVPGKPLHPCLIFASKAKSYLSEGPTSAPL